MLEWISLFLSLIFDNIFILGLILWSGIAKSKGLFSINILNIFDTER